MPTHTTRRHFLQVGAGVSLAICCPRSGWAEGFRSASERPVLGFIGTGIRYQTLAREFAPFGNAAVLCDVDSEQLSAGAAHHASVSEGRQTDKPALVDDYRQVIDRDDIDAVVIATPDHWHTKIAIEAMHAGKDIYCEKPLTLTIDEGRQINRTVRETGRVFQVGAHQRSGRQFQLAAAMLRDGRVGAVQRVTCAIGGSPSCDPLPTVSPPSGLNWDRWLGPAPWADYCESPILPSSGYGSQYPYGRGHVHFRWWYEYGGGKITDWGAHHVDSAMWALGDAVDLSLPYQATPLRVTHPAPLVDGYPTTNDRFNVATSFHARVQFASGVELDVVDTSEEVGVSNAIMFRGNAGRYLVNRGKLVGKPVEQLAERPLAADRLESLYAGLSGSDESDNKLSTVGKHVQNFAACLKTRAKPISDPESNQRHLDICHVINVALRLGRAVTFDPQSQQFVGDEQANGFVARESRAGYAIES
ncbi:MAG: Gfo/Idh/MocA family oxidoreductase [Planctomycetota bacterium]